MMAMVLTNNFVVANVFSVAKYRHTPCRARLEVKEKKNLIEENFIIHGIQVKVKTKYVLYEENKWESGL